METFREPVINNKVFNPIIQVHQNKNLHISLKKF